MPTKESQLVDKMIAALEKNWGGFAFKVHGGMFQRKGMPDILWWYAHHCFGFEAKIDSKTYHATELQKLKLKRLAEQGVHVAIVESVDEVLEAVRRVVYHG